MAKRVKARKIKTPKEYKTLAHRYLEDECFIMDFVSFTPKGEPNTWNKYCIATFEGFNVYMGVNHGYQQDFASRENDKDGNYSEAVTYVKNLFFSHNQRGVSLGHIEKYFALRYFSNVNGLIDKQKIEQEITQVERVLDIDTNE